MKAVFLAVVTLAASTLPRPAAATAVTVHNQMDSTVCLALAKAGTTSQGAASEATGWTCVATGTVTLPASLDVRYLIAVEDGSGADLVAFHDVGLPRGSFWAAADTSAPFGLRIQVLGAQGYAYAFHASGAQTWSDWRRLSRLDDLRIVLEARGFRSVQAWMLDPVSLGATYVIRLQPAQ